MIVTHGMELLYITGTYTWSGTNSVGCDSTATLNLTINNAQFNSVSISHVILYGMELLTQHQVFTHGQALMLMDDSTVSAK